MPSRHQSHVSSERLIDFNRLAVSSTLYNCAALTFLTLLRPKPGSKYAAKNGCLETQQGLTGQQLFVDKDPSESRQAVT
jgi:hypothetical protein